MTAGAFARVIRQASVRPRAGPSCDLCAEPLASDHRHLLDTDEDGLLCACRACVLLFGRPAASEGRYLLVPQRRGRLPEISPAALGVPVGLVFFVTGPDGHVIARYPSPAGATQWDVPAQQWADAVTACPPLRGVVPQVEAVLVRATPGRAQAWLVPIDDCYRLTAIIRQHWKGLSGGDQVWLEIDRFFDGLREV